MRSWNEFNLCFFTTRFGSTDKTEKSQSVTPDLENRQPYQPQDWCFTMCANSFCQKTAWLHTLGCFTVRNRCFEAQLGPCIDCLRQYQMQMAGKWKITEQNNCLNSNSYCEQLKCYGWQESYDGTTYILALTDIQINVVKGKFRDLFIANKLSVILY